MVTDHIEKKKKKDDVWRQFSEDQCQRDKRIARNFLRLATPLKRFFDATNGHVWQTTAAPHTTLRSAAAETCVTLSASPFPRRPPTVVFAPFDRPCDGDSERCGETAVYVEPPPLAWLPQSGAGVQTTVTRTGAYAALRFTLSDKAVRFSALMAVLERAGFTEETSLLSNTWSLKWCKHPVRSDFARLKSFQCINHFPGTWRLGKKDHLHKNLVNAQKRWSEEGAGNKGEGATNGDDNHCSAGNFGDFFPEGWVLPDDQEMLQTVLCSSKERGNPFIVKPTLEACGRGIYILEANERFHLPCALHLSDASADSFSRPRRFIVQRYVQDPLLIEGYKFDLRLYVVVTSYAPLRAYLYDEGLVRFATSPYPSAENESETDMTSPYNLTAHLTNFTINKNSEDFVRPNGLNDENKVLGASKWCLEALKQHFRTHGLNWDGTKARIHDLLVKTLLAVEPHVVEEVDAIGGHVRTRCFEVYGVDVLLRRPQSPEDLTPVPTLMEVNIMPSLSTHYSLLDQCVKGNFIADLLTLVGITAAGESKGHQRKPVPVSQLRNTGSPILSYGHPFLDALTDAVELDACLTAEEEFLRRTHFQRLCPTPESYMCYRALFSSRNSGDKQRSLNEVLSLWEQAKLDTLPAYRDACVQMSDGVLGAA